MGITKIQWTDRSANPFRARLLEPPSFITLASGIGHHCERISDGCKFCYAAKLQSRFGMPDYTVPNHKLIDLFLDESKLREVQRLRKPQRIFWCDMTDMFWEKYPDEWIAACFAVMRLTPQHTHQVLTKRPERMRRLLSTDMFWGDVDAATEARFSGDYSYKYPLPNVWLAVSCEDQKTADERIPLLLQTPAAVRFVSLEPLLGPIKVLGHLMGGEDPGRCACGHGHGFTRCPNYGGVSRICPWCDCREFRRQNVAIDWVIIGGESGPHARPCNIEWIRDIVRQCKAAGTPCFLKQLGARARLKEADPPTYPPRRTVYTARDEYLSLRDRKGGDPAEWPEDLRVREFPA